MITIRCFLLIVILFQSISVYAVSLRHIINKNIPNIETYWELIDFAVRNEEKFDVYIPDESWKYSISKEDLANKLITLYNRLDTEIYDPMNQDLYLLKGLICSYLYNLDVREYYQPAIDNFMHVETIPNRDYRYKWMLGIHYAQAMNPFEAIEQLSYVAERLPEDKLHPSFWRDYGYAAALALMPAKAIKYFELSARYGNCSLENESLYQNLKKNLVIPRKDEEIKREDIYRPLERKEGIGLLSRPFGIWIPIQESWSFRIKGYAKGKSFIFITPEAIKHHSGNEITYTIAIFYQVAEGNPEQEWLDTYKNCKQVTLSNIPAEYKVYEYSDPNVYAHMGGSHGYVVFYKSEYPDLPGEKIEAPSKLRLNTASNSTKYLPFKEEYSRFKEPIHYVFLLDTCNYIFEESKFEFERFLRGTIIE